MKCLKNFAKRLQSDNGGKGCNYFWLIVPKDSAEITVTHTLVARDIFGFTGTRMDAFIAALGGKSNAIKKIEKVFNETTWLGKAQGEQSEHRRQLESVPLH